MSNPFNTINPANPYNTNNMASMRNMYQMLVNSANPMQTFQQIAINNPRLRPILDTLKKGANPQQLFMDMCRQRNINPQDFIKNIMGK